MGIQTQNIPGVHGIGAADPTGQYSPDTQFPPYPDADRGAATGDALVQ